ncbi:hypothetical protein [Hydrogenophaga palleronii]|uniref:hypothetical protein n=1 Tax=Hydrogenophaga palleronii TaxID=65655 RepID=UPI000B0020F1|nr:hypothetical protein [Hydrogenophaga palleronii]
MSTTATRLNPFVLMLDPEAVISAMETSTHLRNLNGRICRPLDKPLIPKIFDAAAREFDAVIEAEDFIDTGSELYCVAQPALQGAVH